MSKSNILSSIKILISAANPFTITLAVVLAILDSFKRVPYRAVSHISVKVFKLIPRITERYTPFAIIWIASIVRVVASGLHSGPDIVLPSFSSSVSGNTFRSYLRFVAPTGFTFSFSESGACCGMLIPTVTLTHPPRSTFPNGSV